MAEKRYGWSRKSPPLRNALSPPSRTRDDRRNHGPQRGDDAGRDDARGARVLRRAIAAGHGESDVVAVELDLMDGAGNVRIDPDFDRRAVEADAGEAERHGDVEMP